MPDAHPHPPLRILALLPLPYGTDWGFWYRDLGLITRALRELGHDAWLVALHAENGIVKEGEPVITATREQLADPAWWKSQKPDAAILNLWGASKWEDIRAAARTATPRVLEKLDTSGTYSARIWFGRYVYENYWNMRDGSLPAPYAALKSLFRACLLGLFPGILDEKRAACLSRMPVLAAESPIAVQRTRRYLLALGAGPSTNAVCIPHPVDDAGLAIDAPVEKENRIVSVGRWAAHQKNFPLLIGVLGRFLAIHPGWRADVLGGLPADAEARLAGLPAEISARIHLAGAVPHAQLARHYHLAKIFFMSSRHESFNIAAAEALCCGCSVVGQPAIASVSFFTGRNSGTVAARYSANDLLDALGVEVDAWAGGERNPAAIAAGWKNLVGAKAVAAKALDALQHLPEG